MNEEKQIIQVDKQNIIGALLNLIVPLVAILLSIVLGLLYLLPTAKGMGALKLELEAKKQQEAVLSTKITNLRKLIDFKEVVDENSKLVDRVLEAEANVPKLLDQVNQIVENSGLIVGRLSYSYGNEAAAVTEHKMLAVALGASGSYDQLILMLRLSENAARFLSISSFRYAEEGSEGADSGTMSASFNIDSPYMYVESTAVTDDPIDLDITSDTFLSFMARIKGMTFYDFSDVVPEIVEQAQEIKVVEEEVVEEQPVVEGTPEELTESEEEIANEEPPSPFSTQ